MRLGKATVVAAALMLVLSAMIYGWSAGRSDVIAVNVGELVVVGFPLAMLRAWHARHRPVAVADVDRNRGVG